MNVKEAITHIVIAVLIGFISAALSGILKLILLPYVTYLLISKRVEFFPALLIILSYGTILTIAAGVICIPIVINNRHKLMSKRFRQFYYLILAMLPIFIVITLLRVLEGYDLTSALVMNDYYIAFWFLLYGFINFEQFKMQNVSPIVFIGLLLALSRPLIVDILPFSTLIRNSNYFLIFGILLLVNNLVYKKIPTKFSLYALIILTLLSYGLGFKFTFWFGVLIGLLSLRNWQKHDIAPKVLKYSGDRMFSRFLFFFPFFFLITTLWLTPNYSQKYQDVKVDYSFNKNLIDQILFKTFADRGLIWTGVFNGIISNTELLPPIKEWKIKYFDANEAEHEVNFEAHNLILGLVRTNGYLCGLIMIYIYLDTMKSLHRTRPYLVGFQRILATSLLGLGIAVFITGQYTLQINSSFFFMFSTGGLIGYSESIASRNSK